MGISWFSVILIVLFSFLIGLVIASDVWWGVVVAIFCGLWSVIGQTAALIKKWD